MAEVTEGARARIRAAFTRYGLGELVDWGFRQLGEGVEDTAIVDNMYYQDAFKKRFPAYWERINAGKPALTPEQMLDYESNARGLFRAAGIPESFYDTPDELGRLISNDVSFNELQSRVANAYNRVAQAPVEVRAAFAQYYGGNDPDGAMVALALDPDLTEQKVLKQARAAEAAGYGQMVGGISVMKPLAERLADAGIDSGQLRQGFDQLRQQSRLYQSSVSEANTMSAATTGVEATFGLSADAADAAEQRRNERLAKANAGGGYAATEQGLAGLGEAR